MFVLTELPIGGRGIILNNGGFYLLKVFLLFLRNGCVIHVRDYKILINTAKKFSRYPNKNAITEPKSCGAGPHISLEGNQVCKDFENVEINFKIDGSRLHEYKENGVHYITLKCEEPFLNLSNGLGLRGRDPNFPHITIGKVWL